MSSGSSFETTEEEEWETVTESEEAVPAQSLHPVPVAKDLSSVSSLSSSESHSGVTSPSRGLEARDDESSLTSSDEPEKVVNVKDGDDESEDEDEWETEEEEEGTEPVSAADDDESSNAAAKTMVLVAEPVVVKVEVKTPREKTPREKAAEALPTCGPVACPIQGPIELDIEDLARICRCGSSKSFPWCDNSHEAVNAARGTTYSPWQVDPHALGSTLNICGCGQSARREQGIPLCDYSCKKHEDDVMTFTPGPKQPSMSDKPPTAPASSSAQASARRKEGSPRPASSVVRVVDRIQDMSRTTSGDGSTQGEDEEETFSSEELSGVDAVSVSSLGGTNVAEPSAAFDREAAQLRHEEEEETTRRRAATQRAAKKEQREIEQRQRRQEEEAEAEAAATTDVIAAGAGASGSPADVTPRAVFINDPKEKEEEREDPVVAQKRAQHEEELLEQTRRDEQRREKVAAERAAEQDRQQRERDQAAREARRWAAEEAERRRNANEKERGLVVAREGRKKQEMVDRNPKSRADKQYPMAHRERSEPIIPADLFDSEEDEDNVPLYLAWEEGADVRTRALGLNGSPVGSETLFCSSWDPASFAVRQIVQLKQLPIRVEMSLPPGVDVRTPVIDALPVLELGVGGQWIRGPRLIIQYLLEKYRTFAPAMAGSSARARSQAAIVSALCEDQLLPLLYLYPSHTVTRLAGRPPVPMRSADKEKVFQDILQSLDAVEGYISRSGPSLMGGVTMADAMLFPIIVFFENFCSRLAKRLWTHRPKLHAWYEQMMEADVTGQLAKELTQSVVARVNRL